MREDSQNTCCLTLPLKIEKWQADRLIKRFEIAHQIYNTLVHAELKKLQKMEASAEYRQIQDRIRELNPSNVRAKKEWKILKDKQEKLWKAWKITEYGFKSDIKAYYKYFNENIGSAVATHDIAPRVWAAFEKKLNDRTGKVKIQYKKAGDIRSLKGFSVSGKSGGTEIIFHKTYIAWKGLTLPLKLSPDNAYEKEMLMRRIKYVRILRKPGKHKDRWYAQLSLEGNPVVKLDPVSGLPRHPIGKGAVGIDIGPRTLAYSAEGGADLVELADQVQCIEQEKSRLQRKMDRSRRASNPDNYAQDGTIKRGVKLTHNKSRRYCKLQKELAYMLYRQAETRKRQHRELINRLLTMGDCFYIEDMHWNSLAHRAKKTEISEKTGRYKRKKRFGKSIANKAPAMLVDMLEQKCKSLELDVVMVNTSLKASQYNHQTGKYEKKTLSQRWNHMPDGEQIQRDLYSAFLLQHVVPEKNAFDNEALCRDYPKFVQYHHEVIERLRSLPKTISSMGIRRSVS